MRRHLYLIGFMGSGKSYTGRRLAERLGWLFVDLDDYIELREGCSIPRIFAEQGEAVFRRLEADTLRATAGLPPAVIACGGGTPCHGDNMAWMNAHGITIYLDTPVELLARRLEAEMAGRPLLRGLTPETLPAAIRQLLDQRESYYRQAAVIFRQTEEGQDAAAELAGQLRNITGH